MIDFHSHILPEMDDGSKNIEESKEMLGLLAGQGVKTVVATPHFYANDESVEEFLLRRKASYEKLQEALSEGMPRIVPGAEVRYYQGISRLADIKDLCIKGSNLLLLEMSSSRWTDYTVKEILDLSCRGNLTVILAHVERYMNFQSRSVWEKIAGSGVLMQVNADFFLGFGTKGKAMRMLGNRTVHLIGSDCHDLKHRPPRIGEARNLIQKKLGVEFLEELEEFEESLFYQTAKSIL